MAHQALALLERLCQEAWQLQKEDFSEACPLHFVESSAGQCMVEIIFVPE